MDKKDIEKIKIIEKRMKANFCVLEILASYLNNCPGLVTAEIINEITAGRKENDEIAFSSFLASAFIEDRRLEKTIEYEYFKKGIKKLDPEKYKDNPYFKNIKIEPKMIGKCKLAYETYNSYEGFVCGESDFLADYTEIPHVCFFDSPFSFPAVFENGVEWMAIKPNEIETMKEHIDLAHGKVAALGLGMGYFAYMASNKETVTGVTVIESNRDVIRLFKENILPQFRYADKINIVESDAYEYVNGKMGSEKFDVAFVDLWHDVSDGAEMYIKMKKAEAYSAHTVFSYWIEKSILSFIRWRLFEGILMKLNKNKNLPLSFEEAVKVLSFDYLKEFVKYI